MAGICLFAMIVFLELQEACNGNDAFTPGILIMLGIDISGALVGVIMNILADKIAKRHKEKQRPTDCPKSKGKETEP